MARLTLTCRGLPRSRLKFQSAFHRGGPSHTDTAPRSVGNHSFNPLSSRWPVSHTIAHDNVGIGEFQSAFIAVARLTEAGGKTATDQAPFQSAFIAVARLTLKRGAQRCEDWFQSAFIAVARLTLNTPNITTSVANSFNPLSSRWPSHRRTRRWLARRNAFQSAFIAVARLTFRVPELFHLREKFQSAFIAVARLTLVEFSPGGA